MEINLEVLRMIDGAELVGTVKGEYEYSDLLALHVNPQGKLALVPYVDAGVMGETFEIQKQHVVIKYKLKNDKLKAKYKEMLALIQRANSKIITPDNNIIT